VIFVKTQAQQDALTQDQFVYMFKYYLITKFRKLCNGISNQVKMCSQVIPSSFSDRTSDHYRFTWKDGGNNYNEGHYGISEITIPALGDTEELKTKKLHGLSPRANYTASVV
jgi:hypothetical protein